MVSKEPAGFSKRLADFAARFEEQGKANARTAPPSGRFRLINTIFRDLRDLFTRDVTRAGLKDLMKRDARETYRFYTSNIDLKSFQSLPRHRRYPAIAWTIFVALAHRLSPPRRIAFALATFLSCLGWVQLLLFLAHYSGDERKSGIQWLIIAFAVLLALLLMELRDKLDLKGDLEIAREIQFGLVPSEPFFDDGTSIHSYMRPANTVGGDYYDIIRLGEHLIAVVIGDVSGKGMPAALLMALLQGSLRTLSTAGLRDSELITKLNQYLCANIPVNRLVTLFYGELNTQTGSLRYVNAGHNAPFLMRGNQDPERLSSTSIVLGVDAKSYFEAKETQIGPGECLLLFTDGITEAFNAQDEEYGEHRLGPFLIQHAGESCPALIKGVVDDVLAFCSSVWPKDDMTLMAITRQK
jgi:serine phosphatase RsbU (regulator of sigma subunit)